MISFACLSPHPPLLLPSVGSREEQERVEKTTQALKGLGEKVSAKGPDRIVISSPHQDWGFNVPLHFLAEDFKGEVSKILTGSEPPHFYFKRGQEEAEDIEPGTAFVASGDLSHRLKEEGPYGFHPQGPKFDKTLIRALREKDVERILALNKEFPEAGECGLRPFCFLLGVLQSSGLDWETKILSYEAPFGVGYLVAEFNL